MNNHEGELNRSIFDLIEAVPDIDWLIRSNRNTEGEHKERYFASIVMGSLTRSQYKDVVGTFDTTTDHRRIWHGYGDDPLDTLSQVFARFQAQQEPDYDGQRDPHH